MLAKYSGALQVLFSSVGYFHLVDMLYNFSIKIRNTILSFRLVETSIVGSKRGLSGKVVAQHILK